jgi:glycosyltransferase involved in cell wall biosynthesis
MTNSRLRICFTVDSRYAGGAERYVSLLAIGLDRGMFDPLVLARTGKGIDTWCAELESAGVPVLRLPMDMPFRPLHAVPVVRALSEFRPHVVHVNIPGPYDGQMGLLVPLARLAGASRVIVTEHLPRVERLWKRALVKQFAYQFVDRVVTICRSNVEPLVRRQRVRPDKIDVVYNGVPNGYGLQRDGVRDTVRDELGLSAAAVGIVFLGSVIERKGIGTLLDALTGVAVETRQRDGTDNAEWRLFVVGEGEDRDRFSRRVTEAGLSDRISLLGERSPGEVERLLCGMDLLVVPSFMEGMPYVILEAMACLLPVVASRIDGIPEAIARADLGLLVEPGDPLALGIALKRFIDDADLRAQVGRNGRDRFEELFTLDRHVAQMERIYLDLYAGCRITRSGAGIADVEETAETARWQPATEVEE